MPHLGGLIPDDPRKVEKIKLVVSGQQHSKGKAGFKDASDRQGPSDAEFADAQILGATLIPSSKFLATPTVQNQQNEGACCSFSVGYARSISYYYRTGASSYSTATNVFSPEFLYNQVHVGDCGGGSSITGNLDLIYNFGVCLWDTMPQVDGDCSTQPNNSQRTEALLYKISNYGRLFHGDLTAVKQVIVNNGPVNIGISVDNAFLNCTGEFIWSATTESSSGAVPHAVCIIGYDDSKNAFKVINSWGTGWGDSGFAWIDYGFFANSPKIGYYGYGPLVEPVSNTAPVANAGFDSTVASGGTATLDGSQSSDPDGFIATYAWTQVSGPNTATINNSSAAVATATGLVAGTYVFRLTVTDDDSTTASDTVSVTVTASAAESYTLTVSKTTVKGKVTDNVSWTIVLNNYPQSAAIEVSPTTGASYTTIYNIVPYTPQGTYPATVTNKNSTRRYRLRIVTNAGQTVYSPVVMSK